MLMKALKPALPFLPAPKRHVRRRHAELFRLPTLRPVRAKPSAANSMEAYPCTRMHGAAFESEYYARETDVPGF
ncbi:MAG: hypothetical protein ACM3ZT_11340 [Bacillota bacterium]